jgi:hypothetical protein
MLVFSGSFRTATYCCTVFSVFSLVSLNISNT